ncbi:YciI family protein [Shouchella rhizosphaerae]|uniref:YciI family protein n=1 Tax=Shouchella rhizosphaerae TaxID=866786 RepID=UPI003F81648B
MNYYVVYMEIIDKNANEQIRPNHIKYLNKLAKGGFIYARGPFQDETGGLIIYKANSLEQAKEFANADPYVINKARRIKIKEWIKFDENSLSNE